MKVPERERVIRERGIADKERQSLIKRRRSPVLAADDAVGVEHRDHFEEKVVPEDAGARGMACVPSRGAVTRALPRALHST
jgi:hypothetical protein